MADLAPRQVGWQRRAFGNLLLFQLGGCLRFLQRIDLGGHGRQVGLDLVFEQALLLGVETFGLSRELHALQERVLVREFVQQRALVAQLRHEARGQLTQLFCAQALQGLRLDHHGHSLCQHWHARTIGACPNWQTTVCASESDHGDDTAARQALPGQTQHQRIKLCAGE
ncbi:hypothetical protein D9M68_784900 [compost metagenome]